MDVAARLRNALRGRSRHRLDPDSGLPAAVLVPLYVKEETLHVVFTKRSETLVLHRGQIAFPGGGHKPGADESLLATALREAHEEIGLAPEHSDVVGALDDIHTIRTNFVIAPFVAMVPHPYPFRPNPGEVEEIFSVPVSELLDPSNRRVEVWELDGVSVSIPTFQYRGRVIWGATERISRNLLTVIRELDGNTSPGEAR